MNGSHASPESPTTINTTAQQRRVIFTPRISFLGWDENNRPVVEGMVGIPQQFQRWALTRKGDPAEVKGFIRLSFIGRSR